MSIVSTGGWPERLPLLSGSGRGVLAGHRIKKARQRACSEAGARRVTGFAKRQVGFGAWAL
ncbi:hypothetical protein HMPREF1503_0531 [Olsenella uli MSTE5]|nr:hypothetical protein HMPREF1503_0531 [Olsenella uli MSTE5]